VLKPSLADFARTLTMGGEKALERVTNLADLAKIIDSILGQKTATDTRPDLERTVSRE